MNVRSGWRVRCSVVYAAVTVTLALGASTGADQHRLSVFRSVLQNGLRVVIAPDQTIPVVTVATFYQVGSLDDPQGLEGMAHLVEHMLALQSPAPPDSDPNKLVREAGGFGACRFDARLVLCSTTVPANQLELVLFLEADRMRGLRMTADRLEIEKGAVEVEGSNANRANREWNGFTFPDARQLTGFAPRACYVLVRPLKI